VNICACPPGGDRLVGALAAGKNLQIIAHDGLAGVRDCTNPDYHVSVGAADDQNVIH